MEAKLDEAELMRDIFRQNLPLAQNLKRTIWKYAEEIQKEGRGVIKIMNFCGTHEWTTTRYGLRALLPPALELVAGPGCPVCVTPAHYVDAIVELALKGIRVYTYGDSFRLRSARSNYQSSLEEAKTAGGDVKVVYSFLDAVKDACSHGRESAFFGIGFETTAPSYALAFERGMVPENLKFLSVVRLTPPAMRYTIKLYQERGLLPIAGVIAPGHVSTITGAVEWEFLPKEHGLPTVVAGFEPIDVLMAIAQILQMLKNHQAGIGIEYKRLVSWEGNTYAKELMGRVFEQTYAAWRGLGFIPRSGLKLRENFSERYDALRHFEIPELLPEEFILTHAHHGTPWKHDLPPGCRCGEVVVGVAKPTDCPLFLKKCLPARPWGPCMVTSEGTCNVWARYGSWQRWEVES